MGVRPSLFVSLVLLGCGAGGSVGGQTSPTSADARTCTARELARERLTLPGYAGIYVEPEAFVRGEEGTLLAGSPIYLFAFDSAGQPELAPDPGLLGVILREDGSIRRVPKPVAQHLAGVRALALPEGGWGVGFTLEDSIPGQQLGEPTALRYGVFSGRTWSDLEDPGALEEAGPSRVASSLILVGDELWWIVAPSEVGDPHRVLRRSRDGWSADPFPSSLARIELARATSPNRVWAAVVRADSTKMEDTNSLFLYSFQDEWVEVAKLADGDDGPVHDPLVDLHGDRPALGWVASTNDTGVARAAIGPLIGGTTTVDLGKAAAPLRVVRVQGRHLWIFDHPLPGGASELRMVHEESGSAYTVHALPNPFRGPFRAVASAGSEFMVVGPLLEPDRGLLTSLTVRFELDCGSAP